MKELIKYIAQALGDNPEQVEVSEVEGNQSSVLELTLVLNSVGIKESEIVTAMGGDSMNSVEPSLVISALAVSCPVMAETGVVQ